MVNRKAAVYDMDFIKFLLEKGYNSVAIAQIIGVKASTLRLRLFAKGIKLSGNPSKILTPNQQDIASELYGQGYSTVKLAMDFGVSLASVTSVLRNSNVTIREQNAKVYHHSNFNHSAFEDMTDERALYFYGLLLADGCLTHNVSGKYNRVSITLKEEDKYMLQNLLDYIGSDNSIIKNNNFDKRTNKTYYSNSVSFNDTDITSRLVSYGFSPRKSLKEVVPPDIIANSKHFWRGMVDGDGCLTPKGNSFTLYLVGSKEINDAFNDFVESNINVITKRKVVESRGLFKVVYSGDDARSVAKLLYKDSNIHLLRKYSKAEPFLDLIDN